MALQHLHSSTADKRPTPGSMSDGQLALNTNLASPGLFFKDSNGDLVKVGPVHVGATAPNVSPAVGGQSGNSKGEQWLDTSSSRYVFKIWDGSAWRSETGEFVDAAGDVMTGALGIIAGTAAAPGLYVSGDTNTGIYSPGADQLAVATNGTGRLFVDASGNIIVKGGSGDVVGTSSFNLQFGNTTGISYTQVNTVLEGSGGPNGYGGALRFYTKADNSSVQSERLRITSAGLVGIGTSTPGATLDVRGNGTFTGNATARQTVDFTNTGGQLYVGVESSAGGAVFTGSSAYAGIVGTNNSTNLQLATNGAVRATLDTSGRVGIGTTSPGYALTVSDGTRAGFIQPSSGLGGVNFGVATNHPMVLVTNDQERARIDSSGRLLVGTSTALTGTNSQFSKGVFTGNSSNTGANYTSLGRGSAGTGLSANTDIAVLFFTDNAAAEFATISCWTDGTTAAGDYPGRLVFSTTADGASSPTERMRIDNAGRIGVNGTNSTQQFAITHNGRDGLAISDANGSSAQTNLLFSNTRAGGTANYYILGYANAVNTFIVYSNGNVQNTNNSYGAISDIKLKENVVDANSQWDDLKALQVRNYNFKEGQTHTQIGLIAQEVELVSPGLVTESPDRDADGNDLGTVTKSVNYSVLYMKAVKALQEAMERIETLEAKVTALESA